MIRLDDSDTKQPQTHTSFFLICSFFYLGCCVSFNRILLEYFSTLSDLLDKWKESYPKTNSFEMYEETKLSIKILWFCTAELLMLTLYKVSAGSGENACVSDISRLLFFFFKISIYFSSRLDNNLAQISKARFLFKLRWISSNRFHSDSHKSF